jgi:hypothetical protein
VDEPWLVSSQFDPETVGLTWRGAAMATGTDIDIGMGMEADMDIGIATCCPNGGPMAAMLLAELRCAAQLCGS